jgi:hypothetical protein
MLFKMAAMNTIAPHASTVAKPNVGGTAKRLWLTPPAALFSASLLSCCAAASAQWTAISLHTAGDYSSSILAGIPGTVGGFRKPTLNGGEIPGFWSLPAGTWTGLGTGSPLDLGRVNAMSGDMQGGYLNERAAIWHGTAQSITYLQDPRSSYIGTSVSAMAGDEQVGTGYYMNSNNQRALLWHGTAASMVDLTPPGAIDGQLWATDGTHEFGGYYIPGVSAHMGYWTNGQNFVDLRPPNTGGSAIFAISGTQMVGLMLPTGPATHAALWPGFAPFAIDMHPFPGSTGSSAILGTDGFAQVGWSHVPGYSLPHAGIWFGTPESFIDLNAFLPPGYTTSIAHSVTFDNGVFTVAGSAGDGNTASAFIWVGVPAPSSSALLAAAGVWAGRRRRPGH